MVVDKKSMGAKGSMICGDCIDLIVTFTILTLTHIGNLLGSFCFAATQVLHSGMRYGWDPFNSSGFQLYEDYI